jgi:hypothetical protein
MLKKSAPLGMITVILLVSLALMGVAYGAWSSTLTIGGAVNTAGFEVVFSDGSISCGTAGICPNPVLVPNGAGKNTTINYTINNAYPGLTSAVTFTIQNNSGIPVNVSVHGTPVAPAFANFVTPLPDIFTTYVTIPAGGYVTRTVNITLTDAIDPNSHYSGSVVLDAVQAVP